MKEVSIIGIDLTKQVFQLHCATAEIVFQKELSRASSCRLHTGAARVLRGDGSTRRGPLMTLLVIRRSGALSMESLEGAMAMHPSLIGPLPEETARVARAAFRKGTLLIRIRDEIGVLYHDAMFAVLYDARGSRRLRSGAAGHTVSVPREPVAWPSG